MQADGYGEEQEPWRYLEEVMPFWSLLYNFGSIGDLKKRMETSPGPSLYQFRELIRLERKFVSRNPLGRHVIDSIINTSAGKMHESLDRLPILY